MKSCFTVLYYVLIICNISVFGDQYQTLLTQTTALEATLAMAIEAKRVADLAAPWLAQLALTNAALTAANEAMNNARFEMETDAELSSKTTVVEASKQANAVFISAIQALKLVERDATDGAVTTAFTGSGLSFFDCPFGLRYSLTFI